MNSTVRKLVSELANDVNAVTPDARVSKRYLFQKIEASTNYYIRQIPISELIKNSTDFNTIKCFPMETVPTIDCCSFDIPNCETVQRSINEIPEVYGAIIKAYNLNNNSYKIVTPDKYIYATESEFFDPNDKYAWIENKRLIIPNSNVETIKLRGYFMNPLKAAELSCEGTTDNCYSPLDEPFNIPGKIRNIVMKDALQSILTKLQIPKDETTNSNSNLK
jgi:hypothetical protein